MADFCLSVGDAWRNFWRTVGNLRRRLLRRRVGYVVIELDGGLPEYSQSLNWWQRLLPGYPRPELSLRALGFVLERIAADPHAPGVVLIFRGLNAGLPRMQSLRGLIERFRQSGKQVVAYLPFVSTFQLYAAAAADRVVVPESGMLLALGLGAEMLFLKDTLALAGVQVEVEAIAPFKTYADHLTRGDISPEHRQMTEWLIDDLFDQLVTGIAQGRGLTVKRVRTMIDQGILTPEQALQARLIDAIAYEDELAQLLGEGEHPARLQTWTQARRALWRPCRRRCRQSVAVISLEGAIVLGASKNLPIPLPIPLPFVDEKYAGSETVAQALRCAERDDEIAAVLLYVDSRGGSSLASDLIAREVARLCTQKPVVVYMGDAAASGGYYVSAPGDWIVAQPATYTGSIGVISLKMVTAGLLDMGQVKRVVIQRGERAAMFSDAAPFSDDERAALRKWMQTHYAQFKAHVAQGRQMDLTAVEDVAQGKVWSGRQALTHGLVDELGDFEQALLKAKTLGGLPLDRDVPLVWLEPGKQRLLPLPVGESLNHVRELVGGLLNERVLALGAFDLRWRS